MKRLDPTIKQKCHYAIPLWLRDEQIKLAIKRVKGRIQGYEGKRDEPIAVVAFGPSLEETWEKIRDFKYIISCSGAHRFLIDRGIIPTWHAAVDPLPKNTVGLIGTPHKDVEYLISSTCHPDVFDHLEGFNVKLWHVFDNAAEALRTLPPNEWALTGGASVGLRCLTIARFFGFTEMHVFGLDGSAKPDQTAAHAGAHPATPPKYNVCEVGGKDYFTTPSMLECARTVPHEMNQMPDVNATFYGEGIVQALMREWKREETKTPIIGFAKPELISDEYRAMNARLHETNLAYGVGGGKHAETVKKLVKTLKGEDDTPPAVLDYGCGKGYLQKALPFPIYEYDPAIPGKDESPRPADLVVCSDVLEHIEPELLHFVLDDLRRCVKQVGYFVIHTGPARKTLPDGRNTHLIQQGRAWWEKKLSKYFAVGKIFEVGPELHAVVGVRAAKSSAKPQAA